MKEQLISFETAKLAKEKGFDEVCHSYFIVWRDNLRKCHKDNEDKALIVNSIIDDNIYSRQGNYVLEECKNSYSKDYITTPTQSLLQKWLREKHNKVIIALPWKDIEDDVNDEHRYRPMLYRVKTYGEYKTYEEALEKGLQEALKLI